MQISNNRKWSKVRVSYEKNLHAFVQSTVKRRTVCFWKVSLATVSARVRWAAVIISGGDNASCRSSCPRGSVDVVDVNLHP